MIDLGPHGHETLFDLGPGIPDSFDLAPGVSRLPTGGGGGDNPVQAMSAIFRNRRHRFWPKWGDTHRPTPCRRLSSLTLFCWRHRRRTRCIADNSLFPCCRHHKNPSTPCLSLPGSFSVVFPGLPDLHMHCGHMARHRLSSSIVPEFQTMYIRTYV